MYIYISNLYLELFYSYRNVWWWFKRGFFGMPGKTLVSVHRVLHTNRAKSLLLTQGTLYLMTITPLIWQASQTFKRKQVCKWRWICLFTVLFLSLAEMLSFSCQCYFFAAFIPPFPHLVSGLTAVRYFQRKNRHFQLHLCLWFWFQMLDGALCVLKAMLKSLHSVHLIWGKNDISLRYYFTHMIAFYVLLFCCIFYKSISFCHFRWHN